MLEQNCNIRVRFVLLSIKWHTEHVMDTIGCTMPFVFAACFQILRFEHLHNSFVLRNHAQHNLGIIYPSEQ